MGIFRQFPYTNFHDINLDWILARLREYIDLTNKLDANIKEFETNVEIDIKEFKEYINADLEEFKEYVTTYLENLAVPEEVQRILNEWLDEGIFDELLTQLVDQYMEEVVEANKKLLTSNDIDIENLFTYVNGDARGIGGDPQYPIFQAICVADNGNFIVVSNDERTNAQNPTNRCLLREINSTGHVQREAYVDAGHANGITYANEKIYIAWMTEFNGSEWVSTDKMTVVNYNTFGVIEILSLSINFRAVAYNFDKDQFIITGENNFYVYNNDFSQQIDSFILPTSYSSEQGLQDIFYYNNYVGVVVSYPNLIAFYDLDTHELVKYYSPKQRIYNDGTPFNEIESIAYHDHKFYICGFSRLDNKKALSNIAVMDPWKNVKTDFIFRNRTTGINSLYIDGSYTGVVQNGQQNTPYKHIMQAVNALTSEIGLYSATTFYCKRGTDVGAFVCHDLNDVAIVPYGTGSDPYILDGVRINRNTNFWIGGAKIKYNSTASTGTASAYIINSSGKFIECEIDNSTTPSGDTKIGFYVGNESDVKIFDCIIGNNYTVGIQINDRSVVTSLGTNNTATSRVRTINQSIYRSNVKMKPADNRYRFESSGIVIKPWINIFNRDGYVNINENAPLTYDAYTSDINSGISEICIECGLGGDRKKHLINLTTDNGTASFQVDAMHAFGANVWEGVAYGTINLNTKVVTI